MHILLSILKFKHTFDQKLIIYEWEEIHLDFSL